MVNISFDPAKHSFGIFKNHLLNHEAQQHYCLLLQKQNYVILPELLNNELSSWLKKELKNASYKIHSHGDLSQDDLMEPNVAWATLHLLFNSDEVIDLAKILTGDQEIQSFVSRVSRISPSIHHHSVWHDDNSDGRRFSLSLNLSQTSFFGGELCMRDKRQPNQINIIENPYYNSAILFKISGQLEHKVAPVTAGERCVFVGWFTTLAPDHFIKSYS